MDGGRRKADEEKFGDLIDRALECGDMVGRVSEQARVMFFLVRIEGHGALAVRLAKHLDSEPSRLEREAVQGAIADAFGDRLRRVTMTNDAGKDRDDDEREPEPPESEPEVPGNPG